MSERILKGGYGVPQCRECSVCRSIPYFDDTDLVFCPLKSLEERLGRVPTYKDVLNDSELNSLRSSTNFTNIPDDCPNEYVSPDNAPLVKQG